MGFLEELWYGNISPCERDFKKGSTYSELLGYIVRHEEDLQKRMNDEEKEIRCTASRSGRRSFEDSHSAPGSSSK